jgi:hypothetical protein
MDSSLLVWKLKLSLLAGAAVMAGLGATHDEQLHRGDEPAAFTTKVSRSSTPATKTARSRTAPRRPFMPAKVADL